MSDREIARRWGMEWRSFVALKQGRRQLPRLEQLADLATRVLDIDPVAVFQVGCGVPAEQVAVSVAGGPSYEGVPVACVDIDRDGTIVAANEWVARVCPATAAEMIGKRAADVFGDVGPEGCPVTRAFLTGEPAHQVSWVRNRDGEELYVYRVARPRGRGAAVVEVLLDVTEDVRAGDVRLLGLWRDTDAAGRPHPERRAAPRAPTGFRARGAVGNRRATGRVHNLGPGGMFLETAPTGDVGDRISLEWRPRGRAPVRARGVIVWTRDAPAGGRPAGLGIRFVSVRPGFGPVIGGGD